MAEKLAPHYGHGISGDRFWPRPALCRQIMAALRQGECVQLFGPRRTGKSSLLKECARRLRDEEGLAVVEVNGEGMDAVASLFHELVAALPASSREGFLTRVRAFMPPDSVLKIIESWLGRGSALSEDPDLITRHWASLARAIAGQLPDMPARPILFVDELPFLCEDLHNHTRNPDEVKRLLAMLREWRGAGLAMAMAGSVGLRQMLRRIGVSRNHLSGCSPVHVGPLEREDAGRLLNALAAHLEISWWNETVVETILDRSADLLPACLQFAFKHVVAAVEDDRAPGPDEIRLIFDDQIRPNFDREFFHQFDERFADYDAAEQDLAREVFRSIASSTDTSPSRSFVELADPVEANPPRASRRDGQEEVPDLEGLILALEDDGFLVDDRERDRIAFASRLVETWWQTRDHRRGRRRPSGR